MKPRQIKFLDFYIGKPICFLLSLIRNIASISGRRTPQQPKKILFLKLIEQGATVLAYPAMNTAVGKLGKENVYFSVFSSNRPILDVLNIIPAANIIEINPDNLFSFFRDVIKLSVFCRKHGIDTIIDMELFSRSSAIICYLSGARNRVGYHRFTSELPYRGNLMSHRIQYNPYIHVSGAYLSLVNAAFSLKTDEPLLKEIINMDQVSLPAFIPDQADVDRVSKLINIQSSRKYIILNPNASDLIPLRKWDLQNFTGLIELINAEFDNCSIIITGTDEEKKFAAQLIQSTSAVNVTDLTGKTSFNDLMTLYTLCDVLITNDSGPGHFSTLTGIHKIILFGPETPVLYGPIGNRVHVIYKKLACSPCVNAMNHRFSACRNNLCMQSITTDEVFKTLCTILKN